MPISKSEARRLAERLHGAITNAVFALVGDHPANDQASDGKDSTARSAVGAGVPTSGRPAPDLNLAADNFEKLYQRLKARLLEDLRVDPTYVKLLAAQPEILLEIEPKVISLEGGTLKGRIARLIASKWLEAPKSHTDIRKELQRTGSDPGGNLSVALQGFVVDGLLTSEESGYQRAPGVQVSERELVAR